MQDPRVFAEALRRSRPHFITALADCLFHLELVLEHKCPREPIPEDRFTPLPLTNAEAVLLDKILIALKFDQSYLPEVNRLLQDLDMRFLKVVTHTELVPL